VAIRDEEEEDVAGHFQQVRPLAALLLYGMWLNPCCGVALPSIVCSEVQLAAIVAL
jgi:hypothetical protein